MGGVNTLNPYHVLVEKDGHSFTCKMHYLGGGKINVRIRTLSDEWADTVYNVSDFAEIYEVVTLTRRFL